MLSELFLLTASLVTRSLLAPEEADSLATDAFTVANEDAPLFDGADGRAKTARLLVLWASRESAGRVSILGDCSNPSKRTMDTCRSLGRMQTNRLWIERFGATPASVLSDGLLSLRVGLSTMRHLKAVCGSVKGALRAYASGSCAGSTRSRLIVESRCKEIGC